MKTLSYVLLLLACLAFVLLGCSDNSAPVVTSTSVDHNPAGSLLKTSGSGAWVFKYDAGWAFWFFDVDKGLILTLCINDMDNFCAHLGGNDQTRVNDIYLPNADPDLRRNVYQVSGKDLTAYVFPAVYDPGKLLLRDYLCSADPGVPITAPIMWGTVKLQATDNDAIAYMQDNENANAFGYKVQGTLTDLDGQVYNLNLVDRWIWNPDGTHSSGVFKMQFTPIRGR